MKRAILALSAIGLIGIAAGCKSHGCGAAPCYPGTCATSPENCMPCDPCRSCGPCKSCIPLRPALCDGCSLPIARCCCGGSRAEQAPPPGMGGPATGAITYPYYTTRGPRDFLACPPPMPIGP